MNLSEKIMTKALVIAINRVLLLLFVFNSFETNAQLKVYTDEAKDLVLNVCDDNKLSIVVFKYPNKLESHEELNLILGKIKGNNKIQLIEVYMDHIAGCTRPKAFSICGFSELITYFNYEPYLLFYYTTNGVWAKYSQSKGYNSTAKLFSTVTDKNSNKAPFVSSKSLDALRDILLYVTSDEANNNLVQIVSPIPMKDTLAKTIVTVPSHWSLTGSLGSFVQQFNMSGSLSASFRQTLDPIPYYLNLGISRKWAVDDDFYYTTGLDFTFSRTKLKSADFNNFKIGSSIQSSGLSLESEISSTTTKYAWVGGLFGLGKEIQIDRFNLIRAEGSLGIAKMLYTQSTGTYYLYNTTENFVVRGTDNFNERFTLILTLNPSYEIRLFKDFSFSAGIMFRSSMSFLKPSKGYELISDNREYTSLEKSITYLHSQYIGLWVSLPIRLGFLP